MCFALSAAPAAGISIFITNRRPPAMNYATAKQIAADHAPELTLDPEIPGQNHICVRASEKGAPFSIILPETTDDTVADTKLLTDSLDAAVRALGVGK